MLQQIITYIATLDPVLIYLVLFFSAFIENIIPMSPSDLIVVFGATLVANSTLGFVPILMLTTLGSTIGFIVMYLIGEFLGEKILRKGKFKFLKEDSLNKADLFFHKYGYKIIIINRFMPGTRAVISFFSGVHRLKPARTFIYAAISSLLWNSLLIFLGIKLGQNLDLVDRYLSRYSQFAIAITVIIIAIVLVRFWMKNNKSK
ncbi:MAG: DedA family protein [Melioribacteraceae bacterium]